jgi:DNA recombination protein RmuC
MWLFEGDIVAAFLQGEQGMMMLVLGLAAGLVAVLVAVIMQSRTARRDREQAAQDMRRLAELSEGLARHQGDLAERMTAAQAELSGRMQQSQSGVSERLDQLSKRVGDGLHQQTEKTGENLKQLAERLAVIDRAQQTITDLSQQMVGLQDILSNKQSRGAFGEIQLQDLVTAALPPSAYAFQATLSNGKRADCLLQLPNPPGSIAIDSKFPLESFQNLRNADDEAQKKLAGRTFDADIRKHVRDIADRYIIPGETADSALMFLPSEAVYAELHANFRNVVEESFRRRVWIVSPTTLMATLNTVRAVLKDAKMREQAGVIQAEVHNMIGDVTRLDKRVGNLQSHFDLAVKDMHEIRTSTGKIIKRGEKIDALHFEDNSPAEDLPPDPAPAPQLREVSEN